jgi:hypothetical protein
MYCIILNSKVLVHLWYESQQALKYHLRYTAVGFINDPYTIINGKLLVQLWFKSNVGPLAHSNA